jgi:hypothetical protein
LLAERPVGALTESITIRCCHDAPSPVYA